MTFDERPARPRDHHVVDPLTSYDSAPQDDTTTEDATEPRKKQSSMVREVIETLILAIVIFVAVRAVVLNFRVDGLSMTPNLQNNEMLLVNRNAYLDFDTWAFVDWLPFVEHDEENIVRPFGEPERGDIVVFDAPVNGASKPYIKRVIALPGETVETRGGVVYIDGQALNEPYLEDETYCDGDQDCNPVTVPDGSVFVLGDNRDNSSDSRSFGPVSTDLIVGKAWFTYWPGDEIGVVPHYDYPEIPDGEALAS